MAAYDPKIEYQDAALALEGDDNPNKYSEYTLERFGGIPLEAEGTVERVYNWRTYV